MEAASQLLSVTRELGTRLSSKSRAEQYRSCRIGRKDRMCNKLPHHHRQGEGEDGMASGSELHQ